MKKLLLPFLFFISIQLNAQLTLTQSFNEPAIGDLDSKYYLDTSAYASGLPISVTGSTCVWNYSNLTAEQPAFIATYDAPSSTTNAASFSGCSVVENDILFTLFLKSTTTPTTQTELLGFTSSTISINLTNSAIITRYPLAYGASQSDNASGTYTAYTFSGPCSGNVSTTADGLGTLNLPNGHSFTNVLRVKSTQNITLSQSFIPIATAKQTTYNYYHASKKFPLLSLNYVSFGLTTSSTPTVINYVTGSTDYFTVGIKENSLSPSDLKIYPNPFSGSLNLAVNEKYNPSEIKICTQLGQLVYQKNYTTAVDVNHLQSGIYFIEVKTDQGAIRKKLVKE